jgi:hypothetical protein
VGSKLIDRLWPDPADRAKAQLELARLDQEGRLADLDADLQLMLGQMEINKIEAKSQSWWQHWRPGVGWTCVAALLWHFIIERVWLWVAALNDVPPPPDMDLAQLITILLAMLGVGTMRSLDKRTRAQERQRLMPKQGAAKDGVD